MTKRIPPNNFNAAFERNMLIAEPTYDQHILKPPEANITNGRIPVRLVINSADRNIATYPNPNKYVSMLQYNIKNVVSIELVQGIIPNPKYNIGPHNNKLHFEEVFGNPLAITVPVGFYSPTELATTIQNLMNNITKSVYKVSANTQTQRFTITSDFSNTRIFTIFNTMCKCSSSEDCDNELCKNDINGSIAKTLGFNRGNISYPYGSVYGASGSTEVQGVKTRFGVDFVKGDKIRFEQGNRNNVYVITSIDTYKQTITLDKPLANILNNSRIIGTQLTSDCPYNLALPKFVVLRIMEAEKNISSNKTINGSYAVIFFNNATANQNTLVGTGFSPRNGDIKFFNPPCPSLDRLTIEFLDEYGNPFDFCGEDHILDFNIEALNQPGKYNNILATQ